MNEPNSKIENWMDEVSTKTETLKIKDGEVSRFVFQDNGKKKESIDYGNSVAFLVKVDGEESVKTFYVKSNNFDLLGQIKELASKKNGTLVNLHAEISRKGSKKSDTRYKIIAL